MQDQVTTLAALNRALTAPGERPEADDHPQMHLPDTRHQNDALASVGYILLAAVAIYAVVDL